MSVTTWKTTNGDTEVRRFRRCFMIQPIRKCVKKGFEPSIEEEKHYTKPFYTQWRHRYATQIRQAAMKMDVAICAFLFFLLRVSDLYVFFFHVHTHTRRHDRVIASMCRIPFQL